MSPSLMKCCKLHQSKINFRSMCCAKTPELVIAAAVRTPITAHQQNLAPLTALQLADLAIQHAIKQAAIPKKCIQQLYMGNVFTPCLNQTDRKNSFADLSEKTCQNFISNGVASGLQAITYATQAMQNGDVTAAIAGGMESMSQDYGCEQNTADENENNTLDAYASELRERTATAWDAGHFGSEIVTVQIQEKQKRPLLIDKDDLPALKDSGKGYGDGAAAVVLTTRDLACDLQIKPLAHIIASTSLEPNLSTPDYTKCTIEALNEMLGKMAISAADIAMWETQDTFNMLPLILGKDLGILKTHINIHGGVPALCNPIGMSGARLVTHLAHALPVGKFGCAIACESNGNAGIILLEKCANKNSGHANLPLLTLYTKDPCPLCDMLLEELEIHFTGKYHLEKVYITEKDNVRFLRLYRHDIPVLFLNGQFLCMHKLNADLLQYKLKTLSVA